MKEVIEYHKKKRQADRWDGSGRKYASLSFLYSRKYLSFQKAE